MENRPFFDTIEMKGGGDAVSAARAVLQTGEYDFAWNMQVEDEILKRLETGGKGRIVITPNGSVEVHPAQQHRSVEGGRRRTVEHQDQAPVPDRPGGPPGAQPAGGPGLGAQVHLWPHRLRHREFPERAREVRFEEHALRVQHREGDWAARCRGLEDRARRYPGEERRQAEGGLPDHDQRTAAKDPGDRQAGVPEGGDRDRDQGGPRVRVFLLGRGESGHLQALLC